jgi:hypothetical protein
MDLEAIEVPELDSLFYWASYWSGYSQALADLATVETCDRCGAAFSRALRQALVATDNVPAGKLVGGESATACEFVPPDLPWVPARQ